MLISVADISHFYIFAVGESIQVILKMNRRSPLPESRRTRSKTAFLYSCKECDH